MEINSPSAKEATINVDRLVSLSGNDHCCTQSLASTSNPNVCSVSSAHGPELSLLSDSTTSEISGETSGPESMDGIDEIHARKDAILDRLMLQFYEMFNTSSVSRGNSEGTSRSTNSIPSIYHIILYLRQSTIAAVRKGNHMREMSKRIATMMIAHPINEEGNPKGNLQMMLRRMRD